MRVAASAVQMQQLPIQEGWASCIATCSPCSYASWPVAKPQRYTPAGQEGSGTRGVQRQRECSTAPPAAPQPEDLGKAATGLPGSPCPRTVVDGGVDLAWRGRGGRGGRRGVRGRGADQQSRSGRCKQHWDEKARRASAVRGVPAAQQAPTPLTQSFTASISLRSSSGYLQAGQKPVWVPARPVTGGVPWVGCPPVAHQTHAAVAHHPKAPSPIAPWPHCHPPAANPAVAACTHRSRSGLAARWLNSALNMRRISLLSLFTMQPCRRDVRGGRRGQRLVAARGKFD